MKTTYRLAATALIVLGGLAVACSQASTPVPTVPPPTATVPVPPTATPATRPNPTAVPPPAPTPVAPTAAPAAPTAAVVPVPADGTCANRYAFVSDVSIPDDTAVAAGQAFVKTWRLRNTGTCTWGAGYALAWVKGEAMATEKSIAIPSTAPGETVDLSVAMTAPATAGSYQGFWALRMPSGVALSPTLWVKIQVP